MFSEFDNIEIVGMSSALPENIIDNLEYCDVFGEREVRKQIKVTGIQKRRCLKEPQTVVDLSMAAVERLLQHTGWKGNEIDVVIYVSAYGVAAIPATAFFIMHQIGAGEKCLGFDINLGCSAFINGLYTISSLLTNMKEGAKGLLVVSDSTSVGGDNADKTVSMLSGDCGTATAVQVKPNHYMKFQQRFDGSRYQYLVRKDLEHNLHMDGISVFNFTITDVADSIKDYFENYKMDRDEIDFYVLHQAQKFIVNKVSLFSNLPREKVLTSYNLYGNTGGPSLPSTLCANFETVKEKKQVRVFFAGFGSGLSWGMVTLKMDSDNILPPVYTDYHIDQIEGEE